MNRQQQQELFDFIVGPLHLALQLTPSEAFLRDRRVVEQMLLNLFPKATFSQILILQSLSGKTQRQGIKHLHALASRYGKAPLIVVQSAKALSQETKQELLLSLKKEEPNAIIQCMVQPSLLGGMRILKDGVLRDASWSKRLHTFIHDIHHTTYVTT